MIEKSINERFDHVVDENYKLENLINMDDLKEILDDFHKIAPFPIAVLNFKGDVLLESHWEPICTQFHRVNPKTAAICTESDTHFNTELGKGNERHILYRCGNGLYDAASPIIIEGQHLGNFFIGQFLLEPPDEALFRKQAQRYGFEEKKYLEALSRVPIISELDLKNRLDYLCGFAEFLGNIGLKEFQRNKAQDALREGEEKYRLLAENVTDVIWTMDMNLHFTYVSPSVLRLRGFTVEEAMTQTLDEIIVPESRMEVITLLNEKLQLIEAGDEKGWAPISFDVEQYCKDGTTIITNSNTKILKGPEGKPNLIVGVSHDITERKRAEEELLESEEYHRDLFENSPTALYLQDFTGVENQVKEVKSADISDLGSYLRENPEVVLRLSRAVVFSNVNQAAVDLYKAGSKRNLLGSLDRVIIPGDFQHFIDQVVAFTNGEDSWVGEARNYNFQKEIIDLVIRKRVINRHVNGLSKVLVSIIDVTELHKAHKNKERLEAQLQQAQKMESIGTLAGGIAHNFNNLLMGIQGNASIMLLDIDSSNPRHKNLKNIEKLVENGAKLTAQLIGYAREGKYVVKPISLNQLVKETSDTFGMTKKEIRVHQELSQKLYGIEADQGQIEQFLLNLYVNAADAMSGGGDLFLKTINVADKDITGKPYEVKPGNYVLLTVRDTGGGMDKETKERIFDPFFTTKGLAVGTGLGMASAYGTIKGHGGYIDVDSEKGKGTTFNIYLPATEKMIEEKKVLSDELVTGKGTVLLVDDEEMVLEAGEELLNHLGYEVLLAENGQEALELYRKHQDKIDLVLLDMVMPVMGGGEAFDRIKEINTNVKVLLSSGYSLEGEAKEILKRGCDAFIPKPFKLEQLSQKLRALLDEK